MAFLKRTIGFALALGFLCMPIFVNAVAIGISPATYEITMRQNQTADVVFSLSRDETEGDFLFHVDVNQDESLASVESEQFFIPHEDHQNTYTVQLNTSGVQLGTYETLVHFQDNNQRSDDGAVLAIRYGLQSKIITHVVSEEEYQRAIKDAGLRVGNLHIPKNHGYVHDTLDVNFDISNASNVYIDTIDYRIEIKNDNNKVVYSLDKIADVSIAPYGNQALSESFSLSDEGEYEVAVFLEQDDQTLHTQTASFSLTAKERRFQLSTVDYILVVVAILCIALGVRLFFTRR